MSAVFTPEEAAELLRVHVNTVYKLLRNGNLPAAKTGRDWRISGVVLDEYLRGSLPLKKDNDLEKENSRDLGTRIWLETDLSNLGEVEAYDWGMQGVPVGSPIRYVQGKGPVVEGDNRDG